MGALGGVAAGAVDFLLAQGRAATFLPSGQTRLLLFLCALYGAAAGTIGLLLGLLSRGLAFTDLGGIWRGAFSESDEEGGRWVAYGKIGRASCRERV